MKISVTDFAPSQIEAPRPLRARIDRRPSNAPSSHPEPPTGTDSIRIASLFAYQAAARRKTEFWESAVFVALFISGLIAVAIVPSIGM
jgi:hypothetical protein